MSIFEIIIFALFGLVFGSFVNALVWRLRQQLDDDGEPKKLTKKQKKALSIVTARSMCPSCKHTLAATDLVPVFSWLALRGKCRYCHKPISRQYPAVELLTAIAFGLSAYAWQLNEPWQYASLVTWLAVLVGLIALAIYDFKYMILPDRLVFKLYVIAIVGLAIQFGLGRPLADAKLVVYSVVVAGGIFWLIAQISKGRWIGGGDVKLGFLLGLVMASGWQAFLMIFLASLIASAVSVPSLLRKKIKRTTPIPFGPFLILATYIVVLYGQTIISWYVGLVFPA